LEELQDEFEAFKYTNALNQLILKQNECHLKVIDSELLQICVTAAIEQFNANMGAFLSKVIFMDISIKVTKSDR